jgi:hypothetical protein
MKILPDQDRSRTGLAIEQSGQRIALTWLLDGAGQRYPADLRDPLAAVILGRHVTPRLTELLDQLDALLNRVEQLTHDAGIESFELRNAVQRRAAVDIAATQPEIDSTIAALHALPDGPQPGDRVLIDTSVIAGTPRVPAIVAEVSTRGTIDALSRHGVWCRTDSEYVLTHRAVYVPVPAPTAVDGAR